VDRLRRRPIMIAADLGRALLLASIPAAFLLGRLTITHLYVVAALAGILTVFFDVAYRSFLPTLVQREHVVEGNSKLGMSDSLAEIVVPGLTGVLVQVISAPLTILFDAISFLFSALFLGRIRAPEPPPAPGRAVQWRGLWRDIVEGLRLALGNPLLRALAGGTGTRDFFGGFYGALYGLYAIRELGIQPAVLGLLIASGGLGALVGAAVAAPVTRRFGLGPALTGSMIIMGLLGLLIPLASELRGLAVLLLLIPQVFGDLFLAVYTIGELSLRQAITPDRMLGRVNASMNFVVGGVGTLGLLAGGFLGETIGLRPAVWVAFLGVMLASLWLLFSPVRTLREQPAPLV